LSFLISAVNAVSVVSNNINNRRNNNNNNNNENNNNQFSTLDSSVVTTQTVSRKRRSSKAVEEDDVANFVNYSDLIVENNILTKLATIWNTFFDGKNDVCQVDNESAFPTELVDSLNVSAQFVRAWIQLSIVIVADSDENSDCLAKILCVANRGAESPIAEILAETLR
jgi:hypothetical protein